jgi:DNA-binding Lrp family transcriptional regulator
MPKANHRVRQCPSVAQAIEYEVEILTAIANGAETSREIAEALPRSQSKLSTRLKRLTDRARGRYCSLEVSEDFPWLIRVCGHYRVKPEEAVAC